MGKTRPKSCEDDAEETRISEIKRDRETTATLDYSGSILEGTIEFRKAKVCQIKMKAKNIVYQDYTVSRVPLVGGKLGVISCLSVLNVLIHWSSVTKVQMWLESPNVKHVP